MTAQEFNEKLAASKATAESLVSRIHQSDKTFRSLYPLIREYVYEKFLISGSDIQSDSLLKLADFSTEQIARLKKGGLAYTDRSGTCGSVSSSVTKKILLILSLKKALQIEFDKDEVPAITTVTELAEQVSRKLCAL